MENVMETQYVFSNWDKTLVLDAGYKPHRVVPWQRAVQLLYNGRAEVVELYDEVIRAVSREFARTLKVSKQMLAWFELGADATGTIIIKMPAVIRLLKKVGRKRDIKFSRLNVLARDKSTCQYCGERKVISELNYDHVIPRGQGGRTIWENIVMSCLPCNSRKGNRTPEQAGMRLLNKPVVPKSLPISPRIGLTRNIPDCWHSWLYWNAELEP